MGTHRRPAVTPRRRLPAYPPDLLAASNTLTGSSDPLAVAGAALYLLAFDRRVPAYADAMHALEHADAVLAALWRRGWLVDHPRPDAPPAVPSPTW